MARRGRRTPCPRSMDRFVHRGVRWLSGMRTGMPCQGSLRRNPRAYTPSARSNRTHTHTAQTSCGRCYGFAPLALQPGHDSRKVSPSLGCPAPAAVFSGQTGSGVVYRPLCRATDAAVSSHRAARGVADRMPHGSGVPRNQFCYRACADRKQCASSCARKPRLLWGHAGTFGTRQCRPTSGRQPQSIQLARCRGCGGKFLRLWTGIGQSFKRRHARPRCSRFFGRIEPQKARSR